MPIHRVAQGECFCSIAAERGFRDPRTLHDAPENRALREARPNPNILSPGDLVPDAPRPPRSTIAPVARSTIGVQNVNTLSIFHVPVTKVTLKSVTFTSDHGVIKDNELDWQNSGALYKRPHWEVPAAGASAWPTSPVSHGGTKMASSSPETRAGLRRRLRCATALLLVVGQASCATDVLANAAPDAGQPITRTTTSGVPAGDDADADAPEDAGMSRGPNAGSDRSVEPPLFVPAEVPTGIVPEDRLKGLFPSYFMEANESLTKDGFAPLADYSELTDAESVRRDTERWLDRFLHPQVNPHVGHLEAMTWLGLRVLKRKGTHHDLVGNDEHHTWVFRYPHLQEKTHFVTDESKYPFSMWSWADRVDGGIWRGALCFVGYKKYESERPFSLDEEHWFDGQAWAAVRKSDEERQRRRRQLRDEETLPGGTLK